MRSPASPMMIWACRDVLRRPGEAVILFFSLVFLIAVVGTVLLLTEALSHTARTVLAQGPDVVVRRLSVGGWSTMPIASMKRVQSIPGVTRVRARTWGVVTGPSGAVTVFGVDRLPTHLPEPIGDRLPFPGEAIVGPGFTVGPGASLNLAGRVKMRFTVIDRLPEVTALVSHDLVLTHMEDARRLLGIPRGHASDLAIEVFHAREAEAILSDLNAAFPWPVRMITREESIRMYLGSMDRRAGLAAMMAVPAFLALGFLVAGVVREHVSRRAELGLLRAMGWAMNDIVRLYAYRALVIGVPALAAGLLLAYVLALWPGMTWAGKLLIGWPERPPPLVLGRGGALLTMAEIAGAVFLPWLAVHIWPPLWGATADPEALLSEEGL